MPNIRDYTIDFIDLEMGLKCLTNVVLFNETAHHFLCHLEFPNPRKSYRLMISMS